MKDAIRRIEHMTYGVELEYTGASRGKIAKAVAKAVGGLAIYDGSHLCNWVVTMPDGRKWQVESDASVTGSVSNVYNGRLINERNGMGGEVVTPILTYADMELLQKVVRAMREAGAKVDASCGAHVHVGAKDMTAKQVQNLVKVFYRQEELILKAAGVRKSRLATYTRRTDRGFVERIAAMRSPTMESLADAYYRGYSSSRHAHYCQARYRTLNLHNLWQGGKHTVEYRLFEGTLHAGEIRANVLLALTLTAYAMDAKGASAKVRRDYAEASGKYDLRVLLLRLGWIGDEFKNPRRHLMERLGGSAAWKDGAAHGRGTAGTAA